MKDVHKIFTRFREEFPEVYRKNVELGEEIHTASGPLPEKVRWLVKIGISAASGHHRALETHLEKARAAGASEEEIEHVLLLLIPTCGFPACMEAYQVYRGEK